MHGLFHFLCSEKKMMRKFPYLLFEIGTITGVLSFPNIINDRVRML